MTVSGIWTGRGQYCELHAHSCYSLLDAVPQPAQLAEGAYAFGLPAVALTDHDAIYGHVPFYFRAQELGVKPILGAEMTMEDGSHLTLLCETKEGYSNLTQLITAARKDRPKGTSSLPWLAFKEHTNGLICLTGCRKGPLARHVAIDDYETADKWLRGLARIFGRGNIFVELQRNLRRDDQKISRRLALLAARQQIHCVATGNVHYLTAADADLQDVLTCIRERVPLPKVTTQLRPNHEYFLRSDAEVRKLFSDLPRAITNTSLIAERCNVELPMGLQVLPQVPTPDNLTATQYLHRLCLEELPKRYVHNRLAAQAQLRKEVDMIERLGMSNYFLVVWDIVSFCKRENILCHGRGSAANSIVAYLLGITTVDSIRHNLVVERFINVEYGGTPDIDIDIDAAKRERVIQYVSQRWGEDHVAMACTYITYKSASAINDAGFALGFKPNVIAEVARAIENERHIEAPTEAEAEDNELFDSPVNQLAPISNKLSMPEWQRLASFTNRLRHLPRHLGQHNGGTIVTGDILSKLLAVEPARMKDRRVVQLDKEWLEQLGIAKIDLLGLRMLSTIADTVRLVEETLGITVDLYAVDYSEKAVYDWISIGLTLGVFQLESGAQVSLIAKIPPTCFLDLLPQVSLIRPGPLQANMVGPYVRRKLGLEPVTYPHPLLENALRETLGVIIFQEQVILIARDMGGFTESKGELLRRALGSKNADESIEQFRSEFMQGAQAKGVTPEIAADVWKMIAGFAGYSFSKAHAASFAVIVYWSAWLRVHYPLRYYCGLLINSPLGSYAPDEYEADAARSGVKFLPFDINRCEAKTTIQENAIRYGLNYVKHVGDETAEAIVAARGDQPFTSLVDFIQRTGLNRRLIELLIQAGAFDAFGERRQLLWDLGKAWNEAHQPLPLPFEVLDEKAQLAPMTEGEKTLTTYITTGVTAGVHIAEVYEADFRRAGCAPYDKIRRMPVGAKVRVGGKVAGGIRRPESAHGTAFTRLSMKEGIVDIVMPERVFSKYWREARSPLLVVYGEIQKQGTIISVQARTVTPLVIREQTRK